MAPWAVRISNGSNRVKRLILLHTKNQAEKWQVKNEAEDLVVLIPTCRWNSSFTNHLSAKSNSASAAAEIFSIHLGSNCRIC